MDTTSILTKTAEGMLEAKSEDHGKLNYDAVRLLRLVDGKTSVGKLRSQLEDLTDVRFQKAVAALERMGLIRVLAPHEEDAAKLSAAPRLDEQVREVAQECLQTLDFTKLEYKLVEAMRTPQPKPGVAADAPEVRAPQQPEARTRPEPEAKAQPSRAARHVVEAGARAELVAALRPKVEEELRAQLIGALRPKIEQELRQKLVAALRPALEAEIRTKLTAALRPRVELELRARSADQPARATQGQPQPQREPPAHAAAPQQVPAVAAAGKTVSHQRLLECMREAVFQTDLAGTSVYVNPAWTKLSGYSSEDAVGKPLAQFFIAEDQRSVSDYLHGIARGRTMQSMLEAYLARKLGAPLRVEVRAAALGAASGDTLGVCGTLREVGRGQEREKRT